ncbi:hypothetical protein I4U23_012461 [Adineta vaga]|nr:hypothetical protein I4U23_012461 [Adineta vaga]
MNRSSTEIADTCAVCVEDSVTLHQCCSNKNDNLCESCWSKMISTDIEKGRIGSLFLHKLPCNFCNEPIERDRLPNDLQTRLNNILLTIPKTKTPTSIEDFNYSYKDSNHLRHCLTDEKFIFLSQRHYNALGNCIDTYIQSLMKSDPWNYREIWLPEKTENTDDDDHHDQVNIFTSDDFETNENGCLILLQGSGVVRPGQWARSCCINESLDIGSMFPYMTKAKEHNLSVIILNPNQTSYIDKNVIDTENTTSSATTTDDKETTTANDPSSLTDEELLSYYLSSNPLPRPLTKKIPNLSTNREHVLYVYDNIILKSPAKKFYIVAHSAGGDGLMFLLRKRQDSILSNSWKIAFTDSVHSILPLETNEIKTFLKANAIHFVASDQPMGEELDSVYDFSHGSACQEVSAGHPKHEYTSGCCVEGVFKFFFPLNDNIDKTKF